VSLVVDASVALKWFLPDEPNAGPAMAILRGEAALFAPDIVVAEVCNGGWRSMRLGRIGQQQLSEIARIVAHCFVSLVGAATLAPRAVAIAGELDHPVYDCLYVALAEARQVRLVTADDRLLGKLRGTRWAVSITDLADYQPASRNR
jgi:predicted nucleic acid-binding protein